jgi:acetylornithine deacetylase/succinyl-diaminopimelate desuccinylase-like protein
VANYEKLIKDLVSIKSLSGEETEIRGFIGNWFKEREIDSFTQDGNLIVHFEGRDRSKAFIFNSHMDTVSAGDMPWKYGAWTPTMEGTEIVGLGASDMKSGLASSLLLAQKIAGSGKPPVDMWFTYVVNEELDGSGTESFAKWFQEKGHVKKYKDMAAIFTEPTNLSEIEHGHRGNLFLKAEAVGGSGHASKPEKLKVHSVRRLIEFADALQDEFEKWKKEFSGTKFAPPTVGEMTSIQAGVAIKNGVITVDSPNKFPSVTVATFDVRTTPDFHKVAFSRIKTLGKTHKIKVEYAFPPAPAGYTDPKEKIIRVTRNLLPKTKLTVSKGSADLGFLSMQGVKAIIFGPGYKDQAHKVNEHADITKIPQAVDIYSQIIEAWTT